LRFATKLSKLDLRLQIYYPPHLERGPCQELHEQASCLVGESQVARSRLKLSANV
jgi:hypothetical protein